MGQPAGTVKKGGYQSLLVIAALASKDLGESFPVIRNAYKELYDDIAPGDQAAFIKRATLFLQRGGFTQELIDQIPWDNFTPTVRYALSVLRTNGGMFLEYSGGGCPCLADLIEQAKRMEVTSPEQKMKELADENNRLRQLVTELKSQLV